MRGLVVFRWLMPTALAAWLSIPVQTAGAHGMGGGGGHGMGGMGGRSMGGRGMGGHPAMATRFFSRDQANRFAQHRDPAFSNHHSDRFADRGDHFVDRRDQFRDRHGLPDRFAGRADRFRDHHFEREGEEREEREFFFRHNFFVGFDFAAFGFPWWGPWGPWWWYSDYADYPYYDDSPNSGSQYGSQYDSQYWNDLAMSVQSKLADQGYYHGQIDGVIGSGSLQAIRQFQADHRLPVTGKINPKLLSALGIPYKRQPNA
jgi:hypothetical protein